MTSLQRGQGQSHLEFLSPGLPWGLGRKSKHSDFKGGGLVSRLPPSHTSALRGQCWVFLGFPPTQAFGSWPERTWGPAWVLHVLPLPSALRGPFKASPRALWPQHNLPAPRPDSGGGPWGRGSPWEASWPCPLPAHSRWFLLKRNETADRRH